ncbi:MAG: hypothetical protein JSV91_14380 [Phycisphaerales bacterium]|nr:MAG: hypothetical protein JSV91_14380 [Phycisphaerales bacterium]
MPEPAETVEEVLESAQTREVAASLGDASENRAELAESRDPDAEALEEVVEQLDEIDSAVEVVAGAAATDDQIEALAQAVEALGEEATAADVEAMDPGTEEPAAEPDFLPTDDSTDRDEQPIPEEAAPDVEESVAAADLGADELAEELDALLAGSRSPEQDAAGGEAVTKDAPPKPEDEVAARSVGAPGTKAVQVPAGADATGGEAALNALDEALADDVDHLLEGSFESVDEVLDGVFEEQAVLVQEDPDSAAVVPDRPPAAEAEPAGEAGPKAAAAPDQDSPPVEGVFETVEAVVEEEESEPLPESSPPPATENAQAPEAGEVKGGAERGGDHAPAETLQVDEPESGKSEADEPAPDLPPSRMTIRSQRLADRGARLWRHAEPVLIKALTVANYPLRFLPEQVRPVVDWIALSLLFWVPIVWLIVLLMPG